MINSTDYNLTTDGLQLPSSHLPFFLAICSLESLIGVTLNTKVIVAILRRNRLHEFPSNLLVVNLAVADFFASAVFLPFQALVTWERQWITTNYEIHRSLFVFVVLTSAFAIKIITIDRYISVAYSLRYQVIITAKKAKIAIAGAWILSGIFSIGYFLTGKLLSVTFYQTFLAVILILTILFMFFLNLYLFRASRKHAKKISRQLSSVIGGREAVSRHLGLSISSRKVFLILFLYVATFAPIMLCRIVYGQDFEKKEFYFWILLASVGNSCINPLIYSLGNRHFRQ